MILLTAWNLKLIFFHISMHADRFLLSDAHINCYTRRQLSRIFVVSSSSTDASSVMSDRVRRLVYQATYTGMKETDLLLGHFAKLHLPMLSDSDLTDFENLLAAGDHLIYTWVIGNEPVPDAYDTAVFRLIKMFNNKK